MERQRLRLVDDFGRPIRPQLERVLLDLRSRFDRQFPHLVEDTCRQEIFEIAARRIAIRELRSGPVTKLHAYAWVALRSVAVSRCRLGATRLARYALAPDEAASRLAQIPATSGTAEQIESTIYLDQLMRKLTAEEQLVCRLRMAGFSSQEIADRRGTSAGAIDVLFVRTKQKLRKSINGHNRDTRRGQGKDDRLHHMLRTAPCATE